MRKELPQKKKDCGNFKYEKYYEKCNADKFENPR